MEPLVSGSRLGRYEIVAPIDAGGMGEVYRARDSSLGRDVAIKVLPAERIGDRDARARFEREGQAIAQLTHPHICTLYDVGSDGDRAYLVMELLSGRTLADRLLAAGPGGLPIAEALGIAIDVAQALAFAHGHQIVHRDVKPANVMLTPTGAKLLDFGLAHFQQHEPGSVAVATQTIVTAPHVVMGTVPYMAPEQLEGRVDARADVFAFGSVLYEMLAGQRAFRGDTSSAIIADIVGREPQPLRSVRSEVSSGLSRIVRRCLQKDPDQRWQSTADLADELVWTRETLRAEDERPQADGAAASRLNRRAIAAGVGLLALIASAGVGLYVTRTPGKQSAAVYVDDMELPPGTKHFSGVALSPDGTRLAIVTQSTTSALDPRLWVRTVGGDEWQLVSGAGPEIVRLPFWSPDSSSLAFFRDGKLVRADWPKFEPVVLCDAPDGRGGAWLDDGTLVFAPTPTSDLWRVSARGGSPSTLVTRGQGQEAVKYPVYAGGDRFLYWAQYVDGSLNEIRLASLSAPDRSVSIVRSPRAAAFDRGMLYYVRDRDVLGQRLDPASGQLTGEVQRVPVAGAASWLTNLGAPNVAAGGGHVAVQILHAGQFQLAWTDRNGAVQTRIGEPGAYREMDLSKNSRRLLASERSSDGDRIWLIDLTSGARRLLVSVVGVSHPRWAPDEQAFAFRALTGRGGNAGLYQLPLDTDGPVTPLVEGNFNAYPIGWPASGGSFVWFRVAAGESMPLGIFIGQGTARFGTAVSVRDARLSPDGERIAYAAQDSGLSEVYIDTFPVSTGPVPVSRGGGRSPQWRSDGRELLYEAQDNLMSVEFARSTLAASTPRRWFHLPSRTYAVADNGTRFLVAEPFAEEQSTIRLLLSWPPSAR